MTTLFRGQIVEFQTKKVYGVGMNLWIKIPSLFLRFSFFVSREAVRVCHFADYSRAYHRRVESNHRHCAAAQPHLVGFEWESDCRHSRLHHAAAESEDALFV
jgi:hypothetical protein